VSQTNADSGSDPLVRGTDPRIRIRTKMPRMRNTRKNFAWLAESGHKNTHSAALIVAVFCSCFEISLIESVLIRLAAHHLGLAATAREPKRAVQFGSRIAKMENRKEKAGDVAHRK
jgi:hypothetical protein